jgi:hypothetical protein
MKVLSCDSNDFQTRHLQIQVEFHFSTYLLNPTAIEMASLNNVKFKTVIVMLRGAQILVSRSPR